MKKIARLLPIFFTICIFLVIFFYLDVRSILNALQGSNKIILFGVGIPLLFAGHAFAALRWKVVLKLSQCDFSFKDSFMIMLANLPIAKIIPAYAGDFVRAYYVKDKIPFSVAAGGIFMEAMIDIGILSLFASFGGLIMHMPRIAFVGIGVLFSIISFCVAAYFFRGKFFNAWKGKIDNFFSIFKSMVRGPRIFASVIFYTLCIWMVVFLYIKLTFFSFGANVPFLSVVALQSLVIFASLLPITIWGIGVREATMAVLYAGAASFPTIVSVGLTYSFFAAIVVPVLCVPFTYGTIKSVMAGSLGVRKES